MSAELYRWSVTIHVVSAVIWVGSMWFIGLVLAPELRRLADPDLRTRLYHRVGIRLRTIGWVAIALLLSTGLVNLAYRGITWERAVSPGFLGSRLGVVLLVKLGLVLAIIVLSGLHDFVYGPRLKELEAGGEAWARLRRRVAWIGRINAVLALIVVVLATRLFR